MSITRAQLQAMLPSNKEVDTWLPLINKFFTLYEITTPARIASFMSQVAHESGEFSRLNENLNYSADRLLVVFPKYFKDMPTALAYNRQPEKIANRVYANRMGNGDEKSGDGWKYRGKGLIQLTGKDNHAAFAKSIGKPLDETVQYLLTKEGALQSALYFWNSRGLNAFADKGNVMAITKIINGGTNGLEDRQQKYEKFLNILK